MNQQNPYESSGTSTESVHESSFSERDHVYYEKRCDGKREFTLEDTGVRVWSTEFLGSETTTMIEYQVLHPEVTTILARNRVFWPSIIAVVASTVLTMLFWQQLKDSVHSEILTFGVCVALSCAAMAAVTFRRIEFRQFNSQSGMPMFNIARSGPSAARFDVFVGEITRRIRMLEESAE